MKYVIYIYICMWVRNCYNYNYLLDGITLVTWEFLTNFIKEEKSKSFESNRCNLIYENILNLVCIEQILWYFLEHRSKVPIFLSEYVNLLNNIPPRENLEIICRNFHQEFWKKNCWFSPSQRLWCVSSELYNLMICKNAGNC